MKRSAPRRDQHGPRRERWAKINGATATVFVVAIRRFKPRTLEQPSAEPCFRYPWTSMMVSSYIQKDLGVGGVVGHERGESSEVYQ